MPRRRPACPCCTAPRVTSLGDQDHIRPDLHAYVQAFSPAARGIFEHFDLHTRVERQAKANLLYLAAEKFARLDLHPETADKGAHGPRVWCLRD
jgi:type I restriction enzyme M protein